MFNARAVAMECCVFIWFIEFLLSVLPVLSFKKYEFSSKLSRKLREFNRFFEFHWKIRKFQRLVIDDLTLWCSRATIFFFKQIVFYVFKLRNMTNRLVRFR